MLGYAGAVAYGLAFTDPVQVCGEKTLDNDFPLVRVSVNAFPPDVSCYWTDSGAYGPSHPTALGTWVMWAGTGVLVVALSVILIGRRSRASRWVRAGAIWSPLVAVMIWVTGVGPAMELSPGFPEDALAFRPGRHPVSRGAGQGKPDRRWAIRRPAGER